MSDQTPQVRSVAIRKTMSYMEEGRAAFNERQLVALVQKTPRQHIKVREGRGGKSFKYVTGAYVQDRLNQVFGWGWSFEVKEHGTSPSNKSVFVLGRLTIVDPQTKQIVVTKEQFGSSEIKFNKSGGEVNYADDFKSAATDALKKCASLLGVAADIYADPETAQGIDQRVQAVVQFQVAKKKQEQEEKESQENGTVVSDNTNSEEENGQSTDTQ